MVDYGSGMLRKKQKRNKKGDAINVINSTAQQLYLVSRYEQHTYQRSTMYVCTTYMRRTKREAQQEKRKEKTKDKKEE